MNSQPAAGPTFAFYPILGNDMPPIHSRTQTVGSRLEARKASVAGTVERTDGEVRSE
ncbi:MAG: hypothetical protein AAB074_02810 [Planctomycetota bacterium]